MFTVSRDKESLSIAEIEKYVEVFKSVYLNKLKRNKAYYDCKNTTIANRVFKDNTQPNNKYFSTYCRQVSQTLAGYFMGKNVVYNGNSEPLVVYNEILDRNDESTHNFQLALDSSIYGVAYELCYVNSKGEFSFTTINPEQVICIYDDTIEENLKFVIRFWTDRKNILNDSEIEFWEVYDSTSVKKYTHEIGKTILTGTDNTYFNDIPIVIYKNNKSYQGDFTHIIPLVDSYDVAMSDTQNLREELCNSYAVFLNAGDVTSEEAREMKENHVIILNSGLDGSSPDFRYVNRDSNDVESENLKTRIVNEIKDATALGEFEVKSHTTTSASSIQMIGLDNIIMQKEKFFHRALVRRMQLAFNYNMLIGGNGITPNDITIEFRRNIPLDLSAMADVASKMVGIFSKETILEKTGIVSNVQQELERLKNENSIEPYEDFNVEDGDEQWQQGTIGNKE